MNFLFKIAFSFLLFLGCYFSLSQTNGKTSLAQVTEQTQQFNDPIYVGGAISFATAPMTAGGSLALVGSIVSLTDIEVQANRQGASMAEQEAFETWDKFYVAAQFLTLAPTGYSLLSSLAKPGAFARVVVSFRSLGTKLTKLPSNIKSSLVYLRNAWGGVQSTSATSSLLSKLENLIVKPSLQNFFSDLTNFAGSNSARFARYGTTQNLKTTLQNFLENAAVNNVKPYSQLIDDIEHFMNIARKPDGSLIPGALEYFDEMLQAPQKFKGGAFGLEILANPPPSLAGKTLTKLEMGIDEMDGDFRFDMFFEDGLGVKIFVETKNYASTTGFTSSFYNQFKAYISNQNVTSIDQLRYFFRANDGISKAERV